MTESNGQWYQAWASICITHARQGARHRQHKATALPFAIPKDSAVSQAWLSPSALRALCLCAHRAPNGRLLAPGGDDRAGGPRALNLLARQPDLLDDQKVAVCPPPVAAAPRSLPRCCRCAPQPAALLPPPGMGNAAERVSEPYYMLAVKRGVLRGGSP